MCGQGFWPLEAQRFTLVPNISSWRPNVTLEGRDVTLKRVFRCKLILFNPEFNFCKKLARSAWFFDLKLN
jgi:hypothetical protein